MFSLTTMGGLTDSVTRVWTFVAECGDVETGPLFASVCMFGPWLIAFGGQMASGGKKFVNLTYCFDTSTDDAPVLLQKTHLR